MKISEIKTENKKSMQTQWAYHFAGRKITSDFPPQRQQGELMDFFLNNLSSAEDRVIAGVRKMIIDYFDKDLKQWEKVAMPACKDDKQRMYCEGAIGKSLVARKDLLTYLES